MRKSISFLQDLSPADLDLLAQLLHLPSDSEPDPTSATGNAAPSPSTAISPGAGFSPDPWLATQTALLSTKFPAHLLRPTSLLPKLAMRMPFAGPKAELCPEHKPLNPVLVRRLFIQLSAEAGLRVKGLVAASEREDKKKGKARDEEGDRKMDPEIRQWLRRLMSLNSLWMAPEMYRTVFCAQPQDARFDRVGSGCEACILAVVGGNMQSIMDLRTSLIGRKKKGCVSRLWGIVNAWTRQSSKAEYITAESERLGRLILKEKRRIRRRRRREKRERRREKKAGTKSETAAVGGGDGADDVDDEREDEIGDATPGDGQDRGEAEEQDLEGSIISFYRTLASKSSLAVNIHHRQNRNAGKIEEDALHPAFWDSVVYSPTSGTFHRGHQQQQQPPGADRAREWVGNASRYTFYTQSAYSQDSGLEPSFGGSSSAQSPETLPLKTYNPSLSRDTHSDSRHRAERRADSYQKLVGIPEEAPPRLSDAAREYMLKTGIHIRAARFDDDADANDDDENRLTGETDRSGDKTGQKRLTTWSDMM